MMMSKRTGTSTSLRRRAVTAAAGVTLGVAGTLLAGAPAQAAEACTVGTGVDHVVYQVTHVGGAVQNATSGTIGYNLNSLLAPGDTVRSTVYVKAGCASVQVSAASYRATFRSDGSPITADQTVFSSQTVTATPSSPGVLTVTLPGSGTATAATCPNKHVGADPGGGANGPGAYGSTCNGSASQNGNGGGGAKGKPCAGCVGNADDKNPPGQAPNGSDHNAGYECDRNNGVGKGNPAHSGCTTGGYQYDLVVGPVRTPPDYGSAVIATAYESF